jgi:arylsulfatase A-like enzyme
LIEPDRLTVAALLKGQGYRTACIGKWHLGMNWVLRPGRSVPELTIEAADQVRNVDYAQPIRGGPNSLGFDYFYGISGSPDMVPYTFIENDRVAVLPTEERAFPLLLGRDLGETRPGPCAAGFEAENVLPELTRKAVEFVHRQAAAAREGNPFFLYFALTAPHTPIIPSQAWRGKSGINPYADFVMETDACIGQVIQALDSHQLAENTLVIVTSDNGCSPTARFRELAAAGHFPSHLFRGCKADIFEGGHRVPFIARWPGRVAVGSRSDQVICLTDLMATCADILDVDLPDNAAEDSVSILPALLSQASKPLREAVVHHSIYGSFAIRQGKWKLALCQGSGGWSPPWPGRFDINELPPEQLYDLESDIGESRNVAGRFPEIVARLTDLLERYVENGRSTPGEAQKNARRVVLRKQGL